MPAFRYTAIGAGGKLSEGVLDVADEMALVEHLRRQGSILMRAEPDGRRRLAALDIDIFRRDGLRPQEAADITRELAVMLGAGQDLDRALRFLVETASNARLRRLLGDIRDTVRDGNTLAVALSKHPRSFSRLYVGLVRAGEAGGALSQTLERLATLLERERALASTITSALIYPSVLMLAAIGSVVLLLTDVLPQFVPLFSDNGATLPFSTQMMIGAGSIIGRWGLAALGVLALVLFALSRWLRQPGPRLAFDRLRLRLPLFGGLAREVMAARFTRTLGTLLINGMPLITALDIVRETMGNTAGAEALESAAVGARGGAGLARPLSVSGLFPERTIHLLQLGEETAQLGAMALRAAEIHEEKTRLAVQRMVSLLTPAITIAMGGMIAAIVASLVQAMLGLNDLAH
ncbi:type II secretion system F family protein [Acidisoma sp.]|uniref:type II secretion system F family protein n=1 Tax=Acidisoma sp. TaxID=1872115 RepID=UPI003B008878